MSDEENICLNTFVDNKNLGKHQAICEKYLPTMSNGLVRILARRTFFCKWGWNCSDCERYLLQKHNNKVMRQHVSMPATLSMNCSNNFQAKLSHKITGHQGYVTSCELYSLGILIILWYNIIINHLILWLETGFVSIWNLDLLIECKRV